MTGDRLSGNHAQIADPASSVKMTVGIEYFNVLPAGWHAYAPTIVCSGCEVADGNHTLFGVRLAAARKGKDALMFGVGIKPIKTVRVVIQFIQRVVRRQSGIHIAHQRVDTAVCSLLQQVPVQRLIMIPFLALRKFSTHK